MELIAASVLSFLTGLVPEAFKIYQRKQDNKHELDLLKLQSQNQSAERLHRQKVSEDAATSAEIEVVHRAAPSSAIELLRAIQSADWLRWYTAWLIIPALYLFVFVDWLNNAIRPATAVFVIGLYGAYKFAQFKLLESAYGDKWGAVAGIYREEDWLLLFTVIGFFFGGRFIAKRFK